MQKSQIPFPRGPIPFPGGQIVRAVTAAAACHSATRGAVLGGRRDGRGAAGVHDRPVAPASRSAERAEGEMRWSLGRPLPRFPPCPAARPRGSRVGTLFDPRLAAAARSHAGADCSSMSSMQRPSRPIYDARRSRRRQRLLAGSKHGSKHGSKPKPGYRALRQALRGLEPGMPAGPSHSALLRPQSEPRPPRPACSGRDIRLLERMRLYTTHRVPGPARPARPAPPAPPRPWSGGSLPDQPGWPRSSELEGEPPIGEAGQRTPRRSAPQAWRGGAGHWALHWRCQTGHYSDTYAASVCGLTRAARCAERGRTSVLDAAGNDAPHLAGCGRGRRRRRRRRCAG